MYKNQLLSVTHVIIYLLTCLPNLSLPSRHLLIGESRVLSQNQGFHFSHVQEFIDVGVNNLCANFFVAV